MLRVLVLTACLFVAVGCEPTFVKLDAPQYAEIVARAGEYTPANREAWIKAASEVLGAKVTDVVSNENGLTIKLESMAVDVAQAAVSAAAGKAATDWTIPGVIGAGIAGLAVAVNRLLARLALNKQAVADPTKGGATK